jgi:hypothetical protein
MRRMVARAMWPAKILQSVCELQRNALKPSPKRTARVAPIARRGPRRTGGFFSDHTQFLLGVFADR